MSFRPVLIHPGDPAVFPSPLGAGREGLVAVGGDLEPQRLLAAYRSGIFPWYDSELPLWWSPDPRALMSAEKLHVSRSLRRLLNKTSWRVSFDEAFGRVMEECSKEREDGTWIHPEMIEAYARLASSGDAHSVEVWEGQVLVGGLYGVSCGALFAAESMFHRRTNASKVALATTLLVLFDAGVRVFDVQFVTPHLASLGAYEVSRRQYLTLAHQAAETELSLSRLRGQDLLTAARSLLARELPGPEVTFGNTPEEKQ